MALAQKKSIDLKKHIKDPKILAVVEKYKGSYDVYKKWGGKILFDFGGKKAKLKQMKEELSALGLEQVRLVPKLKKKTQFLAGTDVYASGILLPPGAALGELVAPKKKLSEPMGAWISQKVLTKADVAQIVAAVRELEEPMTVEDVEIGGDTYSVYRFKSKAERNAAMKKLNATLKRTSKLFTGQKEVSLEPFEAGVSSNSVAVSSGVYAYVYANRTPTETEVVKSTKPVNVQTNVVEQSSGTVNTVLKKTIKKMKEGKKLDKSDTTAISKVLERHNRELERLTKRLGEIEKSSIFSWKGFKYWWKSEKFKVQRDLEATRRLISEFELVAARKGQKEAKKEASTWRKKHDRFYSIVQKLEKKVDKLERERDQTRDESPPAPITPTPDVETPVQTLEVTAGEVLMPRAQVKSILDKILPASKSLIGGRFREPKPLWKMLTSVNRNSGRTDNNAIFYSRNKGDDLRSLLLTAMRKKKVSTSQAREDPTTIVFELSSDDLVNHLKKLDKKKILPKPFKGYDSGGIRKVYVRLSRDPRTKRNKISVEVPR